MARQNMFFFVRSQLVSQGWGKEWGKVEPIKGLKRDKMSFVKRWMLIVVCLRKCLLFLLLSSRFLYHTHTHSRHFYEIGFRGWLLKSFRVVIFSPPKEPAQSSLNAIFSSWDCFGLGKIGTNGFGWSVPCLVGKRARDRPANQSSGFRSTSSVSPFLSSGTSLWAPRRITSKGRSRPSQWDIRCGL